MSLLFLDIETTGLTPQHRVLEIAYFLTDDQGEPSAWHGRWILPYTPIARQQLMANPDVYEMHRENDLLIHLERNHGTEAEYQHELELLLGDLRAVTQSQDEPKSLRLAGFSVHFDATMLLSAWRLSQWSEATGMSHRYMDVRTLVDGVYAATGVDCGPQGGAQHRAYADCQAALTSYRACLDVIRGSR